MKRVFSSPVTVPFLFILAFACFLWGNNAHMYSPDALAISAFAFAAVLAALCALCFAAGFLGNRLGLGRSRAARFIAAAALGAIGVALLNIALKDVLSITIVEKSGRDFFRAIVALVPFLLLLFNLRGVAKFLNVLLLVSICLSACSAMAMFVKDAWPALSDAPEPVVVTLERKNNIYLFWMESFNEPGIIDRHYGTTLVRDGFPDELRKRGFQYFENAYVNSHGTLTSMADAFGMKLDRTRDTGLIDVNSSTRKMLGGNEKNTLLTIMKSNGYFTAFITAFHLTARPTGVSFYNKGYIGEFLDSTDYRLPGKYACFLPLCDLNNKIMYKWFALSPDNVSEWGGSGDADGYSGDLLDRVRHAMNLAKKYGKPLFVSFKGGAQHSPHTGEYSWRQSEVFLPDYRDFVHKGIAQATTMLDEIIREDPEAVIVLIGDHGPARLRGIRDDVNVRDINALSAILEQNGESLQSLVDDYCSVILAIRVPGYSDDISQGLSMSQVNVFWHVFAALNNDPELLKNRQQSVTSLFETPMLIDGKLIAQ